MADGVSLGNGTVKIKVLPAALRIITTWQAPDLGASQKEKPVSEPVQTFSTLAPVLEPAQTNSPATVSLTVGKNHKEGSESPAE
jgi:hypothetical protein